MGIGIVLVFWAIVSGILVGCFVVFIRPGKNLSRKASFLLRGALIFGGVAVTPVLILLLGFASNSIRSLFPSQIYEARFGYSPSTDVTDLEGKVSTFGDSSTVELRFRANQQTFNKLLASRFLEIDRDRFITLNASPDNWKRVGNRSTRYYEASSFDDTYSSSTAIMAYDEWSREVYFYWVGID